MALVTVAATVLGCSSTEDEGADDDETSEGALADRQCGQDPFATGAVRGIDVSKHQGVVDFAKIAAADDVKLTSTMFNVGGRSRTARSLPGKVVFASARVSDGLTSKDGQLFIDNMKNIRAAGLIPGAYQFLRPNQDAREQAAYFIQEVEKAGGYRRGDLPPTVDIEVADGTTPRQVQEGVRIWLDIVGRHFKVRPMVYSLSGISSYLGTTLTDSPLWIANFYQQCPRMPTAWASASPPIPWKFFQFDDAGHVDGIPTGRFVDLNVFNGTRAELDTFLQESYLGN